MNYRLYRASTVIAVLMALILVVSVLPPKAAYAQDGEQDSWEYLMAQFQELTRKKAYAELDEKFSQFSGVEPINEDDEDA